MTFSATLRLVIFLSVIFASEQFGSIPGLPKIPGIPKIPGADIPPAVTTNIPKIPGAAILSAVNANIPKIPGADILPLPGAGSPPTPGETSPQIPSANIPPTSGGNDSTIPDGNTPPVSGGSTTDNCFLKNDQYCLINETTTLEGSKVCSEKTQQSINITTLQDWENLKTFTKEKSSPETIESWTVTTIEYINASLNGTSLWCAEEANDEAKKCVLIVIKSGEICFKKANCEEKYSYICEKQH